MTELKTLKEIEEYILEQAQEEYYIGVDFARGFLDEDN
jgi:hypothetical protein